ncbi:MAG: PepSY-associated TM helix domain-containing protein [Pseudomonadota bacterium]
MKEGFRQSMAWLHTWLGLIVGWILFYVYLTGTLGYLDKEIDYWMTPDKPFFAATPTTREQIALAQERLTEVATQAAAWNIQLIGGREAHSLDISWTLLPDANGARGATLTETLSPETGEPIDNSARATGGGQLLYKMHYNLAYMPLTLANVLIMICSVIMFAGMITGIIAHKKIFKDFFTFRPSKGQRSWLDGHNLLSVGSLPFHLIVTYSGLLFFVYQFMPAVPHLLYDAAPGKTVASQLYQGTYGVPGATFDGPAGIQAPLTAIPALMDEVDRLWGADKVTAVEIRNPGDSNARVIFKPLPSETIAFPDYSMIFNGVSGELVDNYPGPYIYPAGYADQTLKGLHKGLFAGPLLRILYLFMGVAGTAMIGTGLLLWSNKRKAKLIASNTQPHFGIALVDCLNLGTIIGLSIAIAAYFWANRLLPATMEGRAEWEVHAMYLTWAATLLYPVWRPLGKAWVELLWLCAAMYCLLPLVNALTTQRHLGNSLMQGDWIMAGFDLTSLASGLVFAIFAVRMQRKAGATEVVLEKNRRSVEENVEELATS